MSIELLKPFLKEDADEAEVTAVLAKLGTVDADKLENGYMNNDATIRSWTDKKVGKALETFKTQTMGSLVEEQVKARLKSAKDETAAETQLRLINERLDKTEQERKREQHINKALEFANGKIPSKYVHKLLGADIDETTTNINDFVKDFNISINEEVDERFKDKGRTVSYKANTEPEKSHWSREELATMSQADLEKNWNKISKQK